MEATANCSLCNEPSDAPLVACGGDACEARVCGYCLTVDGLCVECDAEACRLALPDGRRQAVMGELPYLAREIANRSVSPHVAQAAWALVEAYREDRRRHSAWDNRRKHVA